MRQFEIWWANLPEPAGRRPVLLLTRTAAYAYVTRVLVAEITTTTRFIPQELPLGQADGLPQTCVANFDSLRGISPARLKTRISYLSPARQVEAKQALGHALGWSELITVE
jgi:mRNA-degrading endonuclease toxin of MazEF toxin-antitoxin module